MATIRHTLGNLISVPTTFLKLTIIKLLFPSNIKYHAIERFSPNVVINIDRKSKLLIGNKVSIHSRGRISAVSGGELILHDKCSFNVGCIIACRKKIEIGKCVTVGPNVMMYDHDHIMDLTVGVKNSGFKLDDIVIGNNTWIGAGSIILSGTKIGENCIIAAGSVVKGIIPDNTVLIQKKENYYKNDKHSYE